MSAEKTTIVSFHIPFALSAAVQLPIASSCEFQVSTIQGVIQEGKLGMVEMSGWQHCVHRPTHREINHRVVSLTLAGGLVTRRHELEFVEEGFGHL